ncbi:multicopper oxidase family protein [Falsiroseomonas sp. HC035]|uniref:multicopper oxidase family protein n=1 Tax=Falsiroseomonas sp. HC035 TaxID=3390999 RepID=UPI003D311263
MALLNATYQFEHYGFTSNLVIPKEIDLTKRPSLVLQIRENDVQMGLHDADGQPLTTTVWGYGVGDTGGYLGPTLLAQQGSPVTVRWQNQLPLSGHLLPVDETVHRADPVLKTIQKGFVPVVAHLHGGETDAAFDGHPEAWYTQTKGARGPAETGPHYAGDTYTYLNEQEAAPLWYHDHALGLTRLNVYAGLAGNYKLTDANEARLIKDGVLPDREIPLVIQDKAFTTDGQLYYPAHAGDVLPDGSGGSGYVLGEVGATFFEWNGADAASALPEFFGDHILVNGVAWPNLDVGRGSYTLTLLNGSDSRFYLLDFEGRAEVVAVATDGGLLPRAVDLNGEFVLAPGDRIKVAIDFSGASPGDTVRLVNRGPDYSPFKGLDGEGSLIDATAATAADPVGNVMQFTVKSTIKADTTASVAPGTLLNPNHHDIMSGPFDHVRQVELFEGVDEYGRVQPLLGAAEAGSFHSRHEHDMVEINQFGPLLWSDPVTETPLFGSTEKWEIFNFTADAHPVHLHLTQYQGIGRRDIAFQDEDEDGTPDDTTADGLISYGRYGTAASIDYAQHDIWISDALRALMPEEGGRQDTLYVATGEMLEIAASFEKAGSYVWHCHILSHEDHEMMRPMEVLCA